MKNVTLVDHPLIRIRLSALRDRTANTGTFRQNLHEIGQLMAYEITREFGTVPHPIETPLEKMEGALPQRPIILVPILRAGLGMLNGILQILPEAEIGHIGMARNEETLQPESYYCNVPNNISDADVLLIDPMLATGNSAAEAARQLTACGAKRLHFICLVAAPEGIELFTEQNPDVHVYTAAIDRQLDERGYILPGLGDAGDRYFGTN